MLEEGEGGEDSVGDEEAPSRGLPAVLPQDGGRPTAVRRHAR